MELTPTAVEGAYMLDFTPHKDQRGWFVRVFAEEAFREAGLVPQFPHHNLAFNNAKGILRGLHYQLPPRAETKVVHCVNGAILDVIVDLRSDSPSYKAHVAVRLDRPGHMLYVPEGCAHGYQTLTDETLVGYLMGDVYSPEYERGLRWDDRALGIDWPLTPLLSDKDASHPDVDWESAWPTS